MRVLRVVLRVGWVEFFTRPNVHRQRVGSRKLDPTYVMSGRPAQRVRSIRALLAASVQLWRRRLPGSTGAANLVAVCKQGTHITRLKSTRASIGDVIWQIGEIEFKAIASRKFVSGDHAVSALRLGQSENGAAGNLNRTVLRQLEARLELWIDQHVHRFVN